MSKRLEIITEQMIVLEEHIATQQADGKFSEEELQTHLDRWDTLKAESKKLIAKEKCYKILK